MLSNRLVKWIVVMVCVLSVSGCARKSNPPTAQQEPTKTAAQYKAEAEKQINEQNASQELARLEQEVAAEEANQP
jgi:Flp pilus assembly protein TadD